jgi:1-acyl-sn-glycerol-3-phosphate acyltransferase
VIIRIGEPLTFEAYERETARGRARRGITDEVVRAIQKLSGQEFVPVYASVRKAELNGGKAAPPRQRSRGTD